MREHIGGHRKQPKNNGPGLDVYRVEQGILKEAHCEADVIGVKNEARMLRLLAGSGFAPELIDEGEDWILQEDLGTNHVVQDGEAFRRNAIHLLWTLRQRGIRHGDLSSVNIIIREDVPKVIDFQQSHLYSEDAWPGQQGLCDSYYVCRYVAGTPSVQHPTPDTPRIARRWSNVLHSLTGLGWKSDLVGKTFLDVGCFMGDFVALAATEGMIAYGRDLGGFSQGINSIEEGRKIWADMPGVTLTQGNILDVPDFNYDVVMCFSTWPYIVQDFGRERAEKLLTEIIGQCGVLFFETQLKGDGPGPDFLPEDSDVADMLGQFGKVEDICTIPVTNRPASRTVWRVEK